jgi:pilus assembly protein Flp/PilA
MRLLADETGQDMIEYALLGALISLGAVASIKGLAPVISNAFNSVGAKLSSNV